MGDFILFAYSIDEKGKGKLLKNEQVSKQIASKQLAWVHMDANDPQTKDWLEKEISYLDPYVIEEILASETRPRMTQIKDGVLLNLRGINLNRNANPEDMVSIRMWVDNCRIISVQKRQLKTVHDIEIGLKEGKGPKDSGEFVCMMIKRLFERMEPFVRNLDDDTDEIEEMILEDANPSLREDVIRIRKQAIVVRRYISPQRDAIEQLTMSNLSWMDSENRRHLQESYNHASRYVEDLDAIRERAQIIKDELFNILSDRLNKNMYVLSVIAAVFLPISFLTGLFGINVGGIPGSQDPNAFYMFSTILLVLVILQITIFKKLKWF